MISPDRYGVAVFSAQVTGEIPLRGDIREDAERLFDALRGGRLEITPIGFDSWKFELFSVDSAGVERSTVAFRTTKDREGTLSLYELALLLAELLNGQQHMFGGPYTTALLSSNLPTNQVAPEDISVAVWGLAEFLCSQRIEPFSLPAGAVGRLMMLSDGYTGECRFVRKYFLHWLPRGSKQRLKLVVRASDARHARFGFITPTSFVFQKMPSNAVSNANSVTTDSTAAAG